MLGRLVMPALFITAIWGTVHFILLAVIIFLPFSRTIYRAVVDMVEWMWITNASALIELVAGVQITVTGDSLLTGDKHILVICNHNNRLDWMFLWCLAARLGLCSSLKIVLKESLRKAPFFGWAMQAFLFVFFSRSDRERDLDRLRLVLSHSIGHGDNVALLLFPEGTDLSPSNQKKDADFARAKGLEMYEKTLHPRTAGFVEAIKGFTNAGRLDAIYDVTVRYDNHPAVAMSSDPRPSEKSALIGGLWPTAVHFRCERHGGVALRGVLRESSGAADWLSARWQAKEKRLRDDAKQAQATPGSGASSEGEAVAWGARPTIKYLMVMASWFALSAMLCYALMVSQGGWMLRAYTLFGVAALAAATQFGGLDGLEYFWHRARRQQKTA